MQLDWMRLFCLVMAIVWFLALAAAARSQEWHPIWRGVSALLSVSSIIWLAFSGLPADLASPLWLFCTAAFWFCEMQVLSTYSRATNTLSALLAARPATSAFRRLHCYFNEQLERFYRAIYLGMGVGAVIAFIWVCLNWYGRAFVVGGGFALLTILTTIPLLFGSRGHDQIKHPKRRDLIYVALTKNQLKGSVAWEFSDTLTWPTLMSAITGICFLVECSLRLICGEPLSSPSLQLGVLLGVICFGLTAVCALLVRHYSDRKFAY